MSDDTRADEVADEAQQPEPVPSSDQTEPEEVVPAEEAEPVEGDAVDEGSDSDYKLPEEAKKRTQEQFEKLLEENRKLKEKATQPAKPKYQPNYQVPVGTQVDKGSLAWQKLQQLEERQTFEKYPELDPAQASKFNEGFSKKVESLLLHSMVNPQKYGGRELSFLEAADEVKSWQASGAEEAKKQGAKEAAKKLGSKEQASLEATGRSDRRKYTRRAATLQRKTREGDAGAIIERLKKSKL